MEKKRKKRTYLYLVILGVAALALIPTLNFKSYTDLGVVLLIGFLFTFYVLDALFFFIWLINGATKKSSECLEDKPSIVKNLANLTFAEELLLSFIVLVILVALSYGYLHLSGAS